MLTLYTYPFSRSLRAVWAAEEIGVDYQCVHVDIRSGEGRTLRHLVRHPGGKVPVLQERDGTYIFESGAICRYLVDVYGNATLKPATALDQGLIDQWVYFALCELEQPLTLQSKHTQVLPIEKRVPEILGVALWEFQAAVEMLLHCFDPTTQEWMVGGRFSLADIMISHTLMVADRRGYVLPAELLHYLDRCLSRPAYMRAVQRERSASEEAETIADRA